MPIRTCTATNTDGFQKIAGTSIRTQTIDHEKSEEAGSNVAIP